MSILVLDIGTTSMRGILYDPEGQKRSVCQLPNHPEVRPGGIVTEDPQEFLEHTDTILRTILQEPSGAPGELRAIAVTSQRSSIIPVDAEGQPLMEAIMWQDVRNRDICRELSVHNKDVFAKTGSRVNTVFSGSKMTWVHRHRPELYQKTYKFLNIPELIVHHLTGQFVSDYTYATRSGLLNLETKAWDDELLRLYEIDREKLCNLIEPGDISGYTAPERLPEIGLPTGIPVIHAGGDQQCGAIGLGVTRSGNVSMVLGTGGFLMAACDSVPEALTDNVICNCSSLAGRYVIEANILACSAAYDWYIREFFGMREGIDYGQVEEALRSVEGVAAPLTIPYLAGRGVPDWNMDAKATFSDVSLATTREELFKSLLEGLFLEFRNHLDVFASYVPTGKIYISGGMTKSEVINQLLADVTGEELICRDDAESTAWGALLVALAGLKLYPSVEEAARALTPENGERRYVPDKEKAQLYRKKLRRMNALYQQIVTAPSVE